MNWLRVNRNRRCPICNHIDWCLIAPDGGAVLCMRLASDREKRLRDGSLGWIHTTGSACMQTQRYTHADAVALEVCINVDRVLVRFAMGTRPAEVAMHAEALGVTAESLHRLGICAAEQPRTWAFPMYRFCDGFQEPCGIRLRNESGQKWTVRGSRSGIFIPQGLTGAGPLLICEGPTDTAAALSFGFDAIGRPSCNGCSEEILSLLAGRRQELVIIADGDIPGRLGAARLALDLLPRPCKIVIPLYAKDMRAWKQNGCTRAVLQAMITNQRPLLATTLRQQVRDLTAKLATRGRSIHAGASSLPMEQSTPQPAPAGGSL